MAQVERGGARHHRHKRVRARVTGSGSRPRLCVYRSLRHVYAQVVDDSSGCTLAAASTAERTLNARGATRASAAVVGKVVGERALAAGIKKVVFDRGGYLYHGRVQALADAARAAGLEF
ncbi:MAG TPA: 50S ribosomal protein L18 [Candidatus Acidoferrales bacterium]|nr:50S ribosomal protein L18 [Candidatus Acidoferrales bacterium]